MHKKFKGIPKKPKEFIDSDGDGLSDWEEKYIWGSDPHDPDTDGDGVDDGDQVLDGRHPVTGESLKNFFIPNSENNYKPRSLSPSRILFHATTAIAIKLVVVLFVILYPISAWMTPDAIALQARSIVALTNELRADMALPTLSESPKLNQAAYAKVQDMFMSEYFAHTSPTGSGLETFLKRVKYNYSVSGENLAMGFDTPEDIVAAWKNSPTHYANLVDTDFQEIGVSLAEDIFNGGATVLTAQYFGRPKTLVTPLAPVEPTEEGVVESTKIVSGARAVHAVGQDETLEPETLVDEESPSHDSSDVLGQTSEGKSEEIDKSEISTSSATVVIDRPVGESESLVRVEAELPPETTQASAMVLSSDIALSQREDGTWQGQEIVYDSKSGPTVPATLSVVDASGNRHISDLPETSISPKETSVGRQYILLRTNPNRAIEGIFDISSLYFKFILALASISLILNIFIQIRKQDARLILSGVGLISLLIVLIIV